MVMSVYKYIYTCKYIGIICMLYIRTNAWVSRQGSDASSLEQARTTRTGLRDYFASRKTCEKCTFREIIFGLTVTLQYKIW